MQKFAPSLRQGPFPLRQIRDEDRRRLLELLDAVRGKKALVLEAEFASPLGLIVDAVTLKERGVEMFCVLEAQPSVVNALLDRGVRHLVYLVHSRMEAAQAAVAHVSMCSAAGASFEYTFLLMPRRTKTCEILLEQAGLLADVALRGFPLDWVPLEEDILSLEAPEAFRELAVEHNHSCLHDIARALTQLQAFRGCIPRIKGKGEWAAGVQRIMGHMRREQGQEAPAPGGEGGIDTLILLDRTVDLATPMCTQLTYEGLLDEILGLSYGQIRGGGSAEAVSAAAGGAAPVASASKKVSGLTSADAVFAETRDRFYVGARRWLNETLRSIQQFRDAGMHAADISRLKGFVSDLRDKFVRIPLHTGLLEQLAEALRAPSFAARQRVEAGLLDENDEMPAIVDLVAQGEPLLPTLRLLCLYCAVHGGVPKRYYDALRRDLLNTHGHRHLLTLRALGKAGMLQRREGRKSGFPAAKAAFKLLMQEGEAVDDSDPQDIHFAYAGYAPLSVRIVQQALSAEGWAGAEAAMTALPGPQFELLQTTDDHGAPTEKRDTGAQRTGGGGKGRRRTVMVVYIGGVTYAEVSALRFLSRKGACDCDFVVATTKVVNGGTLLSSMMHDIVEEGVLAAV